MRFTWHNLPETLRYRESKADPPEMPSEAAMPKR
jgi:hypothetical protein